MANGSAYVRQIDRETLIRESKRLGFRQIVRSNIFVIRQLPEAGRFRSILLRSFADNFGDDQAEEIARYLDFGPWPNDETFVNFALLAARLRDARIFSELFVDLISDVTANDPNTVIDTAHIRFVIPGEAHGRVAKRCNPDFVAPQDPEVMVTASPGRAHRDIQAPHFSTQCNFWFPLHQLPKHESLLLFPDISGRRAESYKFPTEGDPGKWGFGKPFQTALGMGDCLLFHSEQMHCSPFGPNLRPRATVEFRINTGCLEDNAIYRNTFWSIGNFKAAPDKGVRPASWGGRARVPFAVAESPTDLFYRLFAEPSRARELGTALSEPDEIRDGLAIEHAEAARIADAMLAFTEIGPDLLFFLAKLRFALDQPFESALQRAAEHSYFWALEAARFVFSIGRSESVSKFIDLAETKARTTQIQIETVGNPDQNAQAFHLTPARAVRACCAMRGALQSNADRKLFDHRLYSRMAHVVRSHESYDVVKFHLLYVAIPTNREINLTAMMSDASGIAWSKDVRMLDAPREPEVAVRNQRLVTLHSDCATDWAPCVQSLVGSIPRSLPRLLDRFEAIPRCLRRGSSFLKNWLPRELH
jgi:hypothetical protein